MSALMKTDQWGCVRKKINATSYVEAIEELFKGALVNGEVIDRVMPAPSGEVVPVLVQLDDRVFDLTPMADEQGTRMTMVGAVSMNLKRMGHDIWYPSAFRLRRRA